MLTEVATAVVFLGVSAQAAEFVPLDPPIDGARNAVAFDLSRNGKYLLGNFITEQGDSVLPVRWDSLGAAQPLATTLSPELFGIFSMAVTDDGQTAFASDDDGNGLVWNATDGFLPFEVVAAADEASVDGINADASWIVGGTTAGPNHPFTEAYRWSSADGVTLLGQLPGRQTFSRATVVSQDGAVVAGYAAGVGGDQAFRWTEETGLVGLGWLDGDQGHSRATAISDNGRVIGGDSSYNGGTIPGRAFVWTESTGMQAVDFLPGFNASSVGGLSADGRIAVGTQRMFAPSIFDTPEPVAYVWDPINGVRNLQGLLTSDFGLEEQLLGWQLENAIDVSADGLTIIGEGENPEGRNQGWLVRLDRRIDVPEPLAATLAIWLLASRCVAHHRTARSR